VPDDERPDAPCTHEPCPDPARIAIRLRRPRRAQLQAVVYYDDRAAPAGAQRYCPHHGLQVLGELSAVLVGAPAATS
jgi:hypothetical protein